MRSAASVPDSDTVGNADDISYFIKRVTFKLHDTYPNPSRSRHSSQVHECALSVNHLQTWIKHRSKSQKLGTPFVSLTTLQSLIVSVHILFL